MDCRNNWRRGGEIKVSIIVPVYNAGNRIFQCLDTLVNQTLREIEIICVLDCPTDGTDKVVEEYARKDNRIVVVRNEHNLHVSGSRNEGLKVARGEYVGFSDHDDYRELDMYEKLYAKACAEKDDIVLGDVRVKHEDGVVEECVFRDITKKGLVDSVIMPMSCSKNSNIMSKSVWHSIYRRQFIEENHVQFEDRHVFLEEDALFNLTSYLLSNRIGCCHESLYCWDKHVDSESNREYENDEVAKRQLNSLAYVLDLLKRNNCLADYKKALHVAIADCINRYYKEYSSLLFNELHGLLGEVICTSEYPILGRYNLKLVSKKRLKLFFFVLKLKLDGEKNR